MNMQKNWLVSPKLGLVLVALGLSPAAQAHHVYDYSDASGSTGTLGTVSWVTGADGNDAFANGFRDTRNQLTINKTFNKVEQPFETRFLVEAFEEAASNVTEYAVTETIVNNTGFHIGAIELQIGFGLASQFVASANPDGLDFDQEVPPGHFMGLDAPIPVSSPNASTLDFCLVCERVKLTFTDIVAPGKSFTLKYQIDIPSLFLDIDSGTFNIPSNYLVGSTPSAVTAAGFRNKAGDAFDGGYQFTLRQTLTPIPLPGALWLIGPGIVSLMCLRRRQDGRRTAGI